jgi:prepilin-type N-terminal cleavage/methylation domain-containing protein
MNKKNKQGFTIIEMVIVIAVIVVLASIVGANVFSYLKKAKDEKIKTEMDMLTPASLRYYQRHNYDYGGFCNDDEVKRILSSIPIKGDPQDPNGGFCHHSDEQWAACSKINNPETSGYFWCIDSAGNRREIEPSKCKQSIKDCL